MTDTEKSSDSSKSAASKTANKSSNRVPTNGRRNARNSQRARTASNGQRRTSRSDQDHSPYWAATVASLVGVGVAVGFGLFATRRRWMPYAENFNDYLHDRIDQYASPHDVLDDDHSNYNPADQDRPTAPEAASATFPGESPRSNV